MVMERAGEEQAGLKVGGCIKKSHGPWVVHKTTKDGGVVTKYRYPSEKERLNNKQRERKRRSITKKIFAGLRAHGNYQLPKHADSNDLLRALCLEAGWHVDHDGNLHKKDPSRMPNLFNSNYVVNDNHEELADIMKCCSCRLCTHTTIQFKLTHDHGFPLEEHNINLCLSLP